MIFSESKAARYKERILSSVSVDGDGCWIWQKTRSKNGYGSFAFGGGKNGRAHRVSYSVFVGEAPTGLDVCHRCDVRECVNPEHLFLGTRSENILDAFSKKRMSVDHYKIGSAHPSAKLDERAVSNILAELSMGTSKASLSRLFGVSQRVILLISRGETWKHVSRVQS